MFFLTIGYVVTIFAMIRRIVFQFENKLREERLFFDQEYQKLVDKKKKIDAEKSQLEREALNTFTLYEITKDVSRGFDEEEALKVLRRKLDENVSFSDFRLLDPLSAEAKHLKDSGEHFLFTLKDKKTKLGLLAIKKLRAEDREKVMIIGHQFALALRRIRLYQEVERLAISDSLTEVYTRRYFLERFEEELSRAATHGLKLSFLIIDVDRFKSFNDQHGHLAGDQILKEIGAIIKGNVREIDILGRYGGEEFCVVLPDTDGKGAQYFAERIRKTTEEASIKAYDTVVKATLSVGISTFPQDGERVNELVDKADWALYRAKKLGRNRVCSFGIYDQ